MKHQQSRFSEFPFSPTAKSSPSPLFLFDVVFSKVGSMREARKRIEVAAATRASVLLQGESGTGKELCAQMIHAIEPGNHNPYVKLNCSAGSTSVLENELFGKRGGAISSGEHYQPGKLEQASGGVLVLDEIGSLDPSLQFRLLQTMKAGEIYSSNGEVEPFRTQIISIGDRELYRQAEEGDFRLDLLYRINTITISLLPLRQRRDDIPALINYFSEMHSAAFGIRARFFSKSLLSLMQAYDWPGNIRQLDNIVRLYTLVGDEEMIISEILPQADEGDKIVANIDLTSPVSLKKITKKATLELERQVILKVLRSHSWNKLKTAKWLQISYRSLLYKLNEVGIHGHSDVEDSSSQVLSNFAGDIEDQTQSPSNIISLPRHA